MKFSWQQKDTIKAYRSVSRILVAWILVSVNDFLKGMFRIFISWSSWGLLFCLKCFEFFKRDFFKITIIIVIRVPLNFLSFFEFFEFLGFLEFFWILWIFLNFVNFLNFLWTFWIFWIFEFFVNFLNFLNFLNFFEFFEFFEFLKFFRIFFWIFFFLKKKTNKQMNEWIVSSALYCLACYIFFRQQGTQFCFFFFPPSLPSHWGTQILSQTRAQFQARYRGPCQNAI